MPSTARVRGELVARDEVLALAARRWRETLDGRGQFVLIAGEAGIGKSRALDEIAARLDVAPDSVISTRAWPRDAEFPGAVLYDLARAVRHSVTSDVGERILARLELQDGDREAARRYRMLVDDLADLVLRLVSDTPTLLRIEDLHWADELSLDVLERVAAAIRLAPGLVVATYRSDELSAGSALAAWRSRVLGQRFAEECTLVRLDRGGTARLAESLLGEVPRGVFVDELLARSSGIPLYIEELISAGSAHTVPDTIAEAIRGRSRRLDAAARDVADAAAAIGCSFEFELLAEVLGSETDGIEESLRSLCDHHLLVRLAPTKYDYRHAVLRETLYDDIPVVRRRRMHADIAAASERSGIRRSYLSEQFELAGLPDRAHPHALAAARDAARLSAHREAAELYGRAVRTAPAAMSAADRAELAAATALELLSIDEIARAAELLEESIALSVEVGDADAATTRTAHLMGARYLLGDGLPARIALAARARAGLDAAPGGGGADARGRVLGAEAAAYMLARELDAAEAAGQEALRHLRTADDTEARLDVQATLGAVGVFAGRPEGWDLLRAVIAEAGTGAEAAAVRARRMLATSASVLVEYDLARPHLDEALQFTAATERWNDHHYVRAHRAHVRWATGAPDAERDARRALADGRGVTTEIEALKVLGYVALGQDRLDSAERYLGRSLELGRGMAELQRISPALWGLAETALHGGATTRAVELTEEGFALSAETGDAAYLFPFVLTGVRARLAASDVGSAREWLDRCRVPLERRGIPGTLPALDHAEGVLALAEGHGNRARLLLRDAADRWARRERLWRRPRRSATWPRAPSARDVPARRRATSTRPETLPSARGCACSYASPTRFP